MPRQVERQAPSSSGCLRQPAGILVVARPLDGLTAALERSGIVRPCRSVRRRCSARSARMPAVHARRAEEHDRVLDVLQAKPAQGFEIFGRGFESVVLLRCRGIGGRSTPAAGCACIEKMYHCAACFTTLAMSSFRLGCSRSTCSSFSIASRRTRRLLFAALAAAPEKPGGWTIPPTAQEEKNPLSADAVCGRHRQAGVREEVPEMPWPRRQGDGPDADPDQQQDMDLTVARRAARNPDGVIFYKIWNGRQKPKMPAQKNDLTKNRSGRSCVTCRRCARNRSAAHSSFVISSPIRYPTAATPNPTMNMSRPLAQSAPAGEEASRGADPEVREHAHRQRDPHGASRATARGTARSG